MRNPLSLHSGLGSLLFLSLVPVALSLPVGGGNEWPPYGFQNHGFQSQNPNQWPPSSLQSVITQQGPNVPQHQFPQQHLWPFGNAPQLAQNPPGISSTSRILPDDEWDRFVLDSALKGPPRRESLIPPPLPPSHAGWYPSSSEARGFLEPGPSYNHAVELRQNAEGALQRKNEPDVPPHSSAVPAMHSRVSNERASSSGTSYRNYRYSFVKDAGVFDRINKEKFEGKLIKVDYKSLDKRIRDSLQRVLRKPRRVYRSIELGQHESEHRADVIKSAWMTIHSGNKGWAEKSPGVFAEIDPARKMFFNFWGTPGRLEGSSGTHILHYGMGYIDPSQSTEWNKQLKEKLTHGVETAVQFH
ncbi:uncharacterized protein UBRO_20347 [Ustilago bromivora]|uniref:Effector family protein Eff1 n=1 Tax=Ustilago bromivora TaxID=307758 RepID=A0A1K0G688_9BASI|nr:uncharacterized protein UBRO_20347 [Ustilago bromivora]